MTIKLRKTYLEPYQKVETCTDPCGLNRSDEAASTAADDDYPKIYEGALLQNG